MKEGNVIIAATCKACVEWTLKLPDYNRQFNEELKQRVPMDKREWKPAEKVWLIQGDWIHAAEDVAVKYYPGREVEWHE